MPPNDWAGALTEFDELTITVAAGEYLGVATTLRDDASLKFEQLIDLCGVDYSTYKDQPWEGPRYWVVSHLLSITQYWRVRLQRSAPDDELPVDASLTACAEGSALLLSRGGVVF